MGLGRWVGRLRSSRWWHPTASTRSLLAVAAIVTPYAARAQRVPSAPPRAQLVEELRLDAEAHDFPAVTRIWVGPQGQVVVPIQQDLQLRIFDSTGVLLARTGRRGSGPEEFQALSNLAWKADTMVIVDTRLRRMVFVAPDGRVLRTAMHWMPALPPGTRPAAGAPFVQRLSFFWPVGILPDGAQVGEANLAPPADAERTAFGDRIFARVDGDGTVRPLLTVPRFSDPRWGVELDGFGFGLPFTLWPQSAVSPRGDRIAHLWTAATSRTGGTFTVSLFDAEGDTLFVRTFPFVGVPIPQAVKDSALAAMIPRPGQPTEGAADLPQRRQAISRDRMPSVYAGVEYFLVGLDGSVWVALRRTAEGTPVLALDGDTGEPFAQLLLRPSERLRQATRTRAWVTETDADGIAHVVRYRIDGIPRGR